MRKIEERAGEFEIFVDAEMPEFFNPNDCCFAYRCNDTVMFCDLEWYNKTETPESILDIARETLGGYWWTTWDGAELDSVVRRLSAAGYSLLVYANESMAKEYLPY